MAHDTEPGHDTKMHTPHEMTVEQVPGDKIRSLIHMAACSDAAKVPDVPLMYAELFRHGVVQVRDCLNGHQNLQPVTYSLTKPVPSCPPAAPQTDEIVKSILAAATKAALSNLEKEEAEYSGEESKQWNMSAQPSRVYPRDFLLQRCSGDIMPDETLPFVVSNVMLPEGLQRMQKKNQTKCPAWTYIEEAP